MSRPLLGTLLIASLLGGACSQPLPEGTMAEGGLATGPWRLVFDLDTTGEPVGLPVLFDLDRSAAEWKAIFHNQAEAIEAEFVHVQDDSIRIRLPIFNTELAGIIRSDSMFDGQWVKLDPGVGKRVPFTAKAGLQPRFFPGISTSTTAVAGDWEVHFKYPDQPERDRPAVGIFKEEGEGRVSGTFATRSGDLQYLEGVVRGDSLLLSSFNGSQAQLFRAAIRNDSLIGEYRNGLRSIQPWYGVRNPDFVLADKDDVTQVDLTRPVTFAFPNTDGELRAHTDERYRGKVLLVELMGTWCPNCVDEARLLQEFHERYNQDGLEIVSIAFERHTDPADAIAALGRYRDRLGLDFDLLYGGFLQNDTVALKMPYITRVRAWPSTLLIGRDGRIEQVYTGIDGPGTGERYLRFKEHMENTIVELLREGA